MDLEPVGTGMHNILLHFSKTREARILVEDRELGSGSRQLDFNTGST